MKKKWAFSLLGIIILFTGLFFSGPRVIVETELKSITLPTDLDAYLKQEETAVPNLVPNTEKKIIWANPTEKNKTEYAIVYLHGFSATRQETAPLSDELAQTLQANLFYTRLTGHGRDGEALAQATANDWLNDAYEAVLIGEQLGEKVILIGVSTGGTLASWAAAQPNFPPLHALILISPNFGPKDGNAELLLLPWADSIIPLAVGPERSWEGENKLHEQYWTNSYPTEALFPMMGLVELARTLPFNQIKTPTLALYDPQDQVVDEEKTVDIVSQFNNKHNQLIPIRDSEDSNHHVLAGAILAPHDTEKIKQLILTFINQLP